VKPQCLARAKPYESPETSGDRPVQDLVDQGDLIATQVLLPPVSSAIQSRLCRAATGSPIPPQGRARLATYRGLVTVTVDGAAVDGAVPGAWAKYAIPKGLPAEEGERRMAIENQPHRVDDFDGVIAEGYGKGLKKLVYSGTVAVKIDGETSLRKINIHRHEAERAGRALRSGVRRRSHEHGALGVAYPERPVQGPLRVSSMHPALCPPANTTRAA